MIDFEGKITSLTLEYLYCPTCKQRYYGGAMCKCMAYKQPGSIIVNFPNAELIKGPNHGQSILNINKDSDSGLLYTLMVLDPTEDEDNEGE